VPRSPSSPLVAVPAYRLAPGRVRGWADGAAAVPSAYIEALWRAGVRPVLLASPDPTPPADVLAVFAGLVLVGGGDIEPSHYGETRHPAVYGTDPERDDFELGLVRAAVAATLPLFAICRGLQVLNVAFGGTLIQHLADRPGTGVHGMPPADDSRVSHDVSILGGSRLAAAAGARTLAGCVSVHHQAVDRMAPGLVATAHSADGVIEALETPADRAGWVLAVQWHPERTAAADPAQQALFDAFGAAVRASSPAVR
jgi:putative glutamine amidotransferase